MNALGYISTPQSPGRPPVLRWSEREWRWFCSCLAISAGLYLLYALICNDPLHPDEYFQVAEFASYKLGRTPAADLPWEFADRMRSWLQPAICVALVRAGQLLGIEHPLTFLVVFRLAFGLLSWASLWALIVAGRSWLSSESDRIGVYVVAALFWLIPTIGVRASGESASTALLCLAIAALEWRRTYGAIEHRFGLAFAGGLALALCFAFRFPSGAMAAGAALAYLCDRAGRGQLIAAGCLGALVGLSVMFALDWWGYGAPTIPFVHYIEQNFVHHRAASFGTEPFYAYFYLPLDEPFKEISMTSMAITIVAWLRRPGHVLTWATLPYFLFLMATAHKETRFLFPLVFFVPFFAMFAFEGLRGSGRALLLRLSVNLLLVYFLLFNVFALLVASIKLGSVGEFRLFRKISEEARQSPGQLDLFAIRGKMYSIYFPQSFLPMRFVEPENLRLTDKSDATGSDLFRAETRPFLVVVDVPNKLAEASEYVAKHCTLIEASIPEWMRERPGWSEKAEPYRRLYRCG